MAVALLITFETSQADHIVTQLRAFKEREFDRNPPRGFRNATIEDHPESSTVVFRSEWDNDDALEYVRDSAPFEACLDLCDIYADGRDDRKVDLG
jgi:quinol monooxygenase YgiN